MPRKGGGPSAAKGGGKGQPQAKAAPGPNGRTVGTKGGTSTSRLPCYANYEGKCKDAACRLNHRSLTPIEVPLYEAWKVKSATRAASPGAPASGVCPDFLKGSCALGAQCAMEHPEGPSKTARCGRPRRRLRRPLALDGHAATAGFPLQPSPSTF